MQIPIISGIYSDSIAEFRTSYPVNMVPVPKVSGISSGYLRPADGAVRLGAGIGEPRGGISWNGELYRVMGTKLVKIDSAHNITILGDVGVGGQCIFDYSFDRLAIASGGRLYYWDGLNLVQVVDIDLGTVISFCWVDGYFFITDGLHLIVTELTNPLSINPIKYGSSEIDPDQIVAVLKLRNEVYAINRNTIEVFDNIGGDYFPFERINGAQIQKGAIGPHAVCVFSETIAFVGSGRNEPCGVYLGVNSTSTKISTREIDELLQNCSELELSNIVLYSRTILDHKHLWIKLPDRTLVYDLAASQVVGEPVWFQLTSAVEDFSEYRAVDPVWCYDKWMVCDSLTGDIGYLTREIAHHFGEVVRWEFGTTIVYNEGRGAIFNALELVCLSGRVEFGETPYISTSYTLNGLTWSQDKPIRAGQTGDTLRRLIWHQQGHMRNWRSQRFTGDSRAFISVARLEATLEPLNV